MSTHESTIDIAEAVFETHLPLPGRRQGKVRDIYELPARDGHPPRVLIIATDRISAFDVVLPTPIPGKGRLLTQVSLKWFDHLRPLGLIDDYIISGEPQDVPGLDESHCARIEGRMMLGAAAQVIPVEFVVRGYITGSGWSEYKRSQSICGIQLPAGIQQCQKLPEPIFTPTTKADVGHDEAISFEQSCDIAGKDVMTRLRDVSLHLYNAASAHAESRGIILADTKFEFGYALDEHGKPTDHILLIDEIFTPDSSRFWPADAYEPGRDQSSFDKQYVRNYLQELVGEGKWNKTPPGPVLPPDVVRNTVARYEEAVTRLFGG